MKLRHSKWMLLTLLSLLALPSSAVTPTAPAPTPDQAATEIRQAYDRLATLIGRAGHEVSFEISEIETFPATEFDELYYADTVGMPDGWAIQATRSQRTMRATDEAGVTRGWETLEYGAQWKRQDRLPMSEEELQLWRSERVSEILERIRQGGEAVGEAEALTRYRVEARLDGRVVDYRAAFFWLRQSKPDKPEWRGVPVDMITSGVREVVESPGRL